MLEIPVADVHITEFATSLCQKTAGCCVTRNRGLTCGYSGHHRCDARAVPTSPTRPQMFDSRQLPTSPSAQTCEMSLSSCRQKSCVGRGACRSFRGWSLQKCPEPQAVFRSTKRTPCLKPQTLKSTTCQTLLYVAISNLTLLSETSDQEAVLRDTGTVAHYVGS